MLRVSAALNLFPCLQHKQRQLFHTVSDAASLARATAHHGDAIMAIDAWQASQSRCVHDGGHAASTLWILGMAFPAPADRGCPRWRDSEAWDATVDERARRSHAWSALQLLMQAPLATCLSASACVAMQAIVSTQGHGKHRCAVLAAELAPAVSTFQLVMAM
jgi:hypothetical protein